MKNYINEQFLTASAFLFTLTLLSLVAYRILNALLLPEDWATILSLSTFFICLSFLCYGNFLYFFCRYGYLKRQKNFKPTKEGELRAFFDHHHPSLTILIPSYKEEIDVVKQTMLSSILQEYPQKKIVLLIDDPTFPTDREESQRLEIVRNLPHELQELIEPMAKQLKQALWAFESRSKDQKLDIKEECQLLAKLNHQLAQWFDTLRLLFPSNDHVTTHFVSLTLTSRVEKHFKKAEEVLKGEWSFEKLYREYRYFSSLLEVQISTFERKKYKNFSHAPNKAMNLNSYLSVMGKNFIERQEQDGISLIESEKTLESIAFSDSKYVAMLDADTILTHDYAARLVYEMEKGENSKMAVIQTPYSAFPGSPGVLETIAGATTDIQYIIHQGFTNYGATFWVGANALIRKKALDDIVEYYEENGYSIARHIQDHTVIEDTESSIDLMSKGWALTNYPSRLSYSATPPDFGSLLIQRRRWANGGLLILPKLFSYLFKSPFQISRWIESFFRFHYLFSIAGMTAMIPVMSILAYISPDYTFVFIAASIPYLWLYARDLSQHGYRHVDIFKVIALNALLIPINAAGVLKSIEQGITGIHTPFCRTPKVSGRTTVPPLYVFILLTLFFWCITMLVSTSAFNPTIENMICSMIYSLPIIYGFLAFLGIKASFQDLGLLMTAFYEREEERTKLFIN